VNKAIAKVVVEEEKEGSAILICRVRLRRWIDELR